MSKILSIKARQILDSRGLPTIECNLKTKDGVFTSKVPSGASTGSHEALELRDGGKAFHGKGVLKAVKNINTKIALKLKGKDCTNQDNIDQVMLDLDGTANKRKLGANAILAVSMAACRAGASALNAPLYKYIAHLYDNKKLSMPVPSFNVINGGKHAGNKLDVQEYMIMPTRAKSFAKAVQIASETYHTLKKLLEHHYGKSAINVGDEGGFAPPMDGVEEPFEFLTNALMQNGYNKKVDFAIDAAATEFFRHGKYYLDGSELSPDELLETYGDLVERYPLKSIEDPFQEEDFEQFAKITKALKKTQIVADDLTVTNPKRVQKAMVLGSANCLLLKVNQIGTVTEALQAAQLAQKDKWKIMVSHRSGETTDDFIADLAVGMGSAFIKAGAPCRGERLAKYNRLIQIEEDLGKVKYG